MSLSVRTMNDRQSQPHISRFSPSTQGSKMKMFPLLLLLLSINVTNAFNIIPSFSSQCKNFKLSPLFAVTEEDVLFMVERAESLWEEALNARYEECVIVTN